MKSIKKKMIIKVIVDLENQQLGVANISSNTNIGSLKEGREFLSLVFQQLADTYKKASKQNEI